MRSRAVERLLPAKPARLTADAEVLRALPRRECRRVGSFVFLDHFGSGAAGAQVDIPPHPHAGLQTVTYLHSGAIEHRDSLGSVQRIEPDDVNWMTAGGGIVHSEKGVAGSYPLRGVQTWVGLPPGQRAGAPAFDHFAAATLPVLETGGTQLRVIAGAVGNLQSPVPSLLPLTYFDLMLQAGAELQVPVAADHELALYIVSGDIVVDQTPIGMGVLATLGASGTVVSMHSTRGARAILLGGAPLPEPTAIWWNFVADSVEEGRRLQARWEAGGFPQMPGAA